MKKNKMLRLASALSILALLTTSIIGGTFAKYVTIGSAFDTARVAKWGVVITTSGSLYSDAYASATAGADKADLPTAWVANPSADSITVAAATAKENVVAPGTKSVGGLSFSLSGKPEVAVKVTTTITAEDIYLKSGTYGVLIPTTIDSTDSLKKAMEASTHQGVYAFKNNAYTKVATGDAYDDTNQYFLLTNKVTVADDYFPVTYTLTDSGTHPDDNTAVEVADVLAKAIDTNANPAAGNTVYKATYTDIFHDYAANTDLAAAGPLHSEKLSWEWKFDDGKNDADTILGEMIAARGATGTPAYVVVSIDTANHDAMTAITYDTTAAADDYTAKANGAVVANLRTKFDISLTVAQID